MTLEQLVHDVEFRIYDLGKRFWSNGPVVQMREQADELGAELCQRREALARCSQALEAVRSRLAENEGRAALLLSRVETYVHVADQVNAWEHALELDRIRQAVREDRDRRDHLEHALRHHRSHIGKLQQGLATLENKLYERIGGRRQTTE